jgi:hypothetical protein
VRGGIGPNAVRAIGARWPIPEQLAETIRSAVVEITRIRARGWYAGTAAELCAGHLALRLVIGIYLRLTDLGPSGYALLRSVCAMVHLIPAAGRDHGKSPPCRNRSANGGTAEGDLGVRPGESDSTRMVGGVLLVVLATIISVLLLVWWLT